MEIYSRININEICKKVCSGGTPKSTHTEYYGGNIPWLNTKEVNFNRIYKTEKNITESGLENSSAKWIEPNAVIVAMYGATAGKTAIAKIPLTTNQACCNLMIDEEKADYRFVYYALCNDYIRLASLANGGAQQNLNAQQIKDFDIPYPDAETQQKIANILSSLDDKIEVNRRINEQLEELAQALFKSWFVDFEPFKDGEFVESELVKLGDVVKTTSGGTPSRKHIEYYGGNYGWVKSKELNGTFIVDTEETITDEAIAKSSAKLLPEKSILIAMYGATVGQYAILSKAMTCNQAVCALLPNDNYPYTYLFMFAKNKKDELINKAVGSAQQNISQILIKDLDISNDIQRIKDYHKIVSPAFEIIEKNQQEITHLTNLRDTLLPKLMSGEIDVEQFNVIE